MFAAIAILDTNNTQESSDCEIIVEQWVLSRTHTKEYEKKVRGKIWNVKLTHYGHIGGSLIGKYRPIHTLVPWIELSINYILSPHHMQPYINFPHPSRQSFQCHRHHRLRRDYCKPHGTSDRKVSRVVQSVWNLLKFLHELAEQL